MAHLQSALSDLSDQLIGTDPTFTTALGEIAAAALQELIEAELTARIVTLSSDAHSGTRQAIVGVRRPLVHRTSASPVCTRHRSDG